MMSAKKDFEDGFPLPKEEPLPGYYDRPCSVWQRLPYRSDTGGVAPMFLEGREWQKNERIRGMTPERRAWRKKFLQDQILSPREPVHVPQIYYELNNPIRRVIHYPFRKLESALTPYVGAFGAASIRSFTSLFLTGIAVTYAITYFSMYRGGTWELDGGVRFILAKPVIYPGDQYYPFVSQKTKGEDYHDYGFKKSIFYKSEERIRAEEANSSFH